MVELAKLDKYSVYRHALFAAGPEHQILVRAIGRMMDLTHPAQGIAFADYRSAVHEAHERAERSPSRGAHISSTGRGARQSMRS